MVSSISYVIMTNIFLTLCTSFQNFVLKPDCNDLCLKNLGMLFFSLKCISGLSISLWSMAIFLLIVYSIFLVVAASLEFTRSQVVASIPGTFFCVWYALKKHWLANNILGIAFCIQVSSFPRTKINLILLLTSIVTCALQSIDVLLTFLPFLFIYSFLLNYFT